jgi:HlyD family secretion protein
VEPDLKNLRINRGSGPGSEGEIAPEGAASRWSSRWIVTGVVIFAVLGAASTLWKRANAAQEVDTVRAAAPMATSGETVVLNATGYIVAAHKIQVAAKVVGKVAWIGVEKGDRVQEGQVLVRLEDDEYRAQLAQAKGQLENLTARLAELEHGSRPEEIATALANLEQAKADLENARVTLDRTRPLVKEGVFSKQSLDDAEAKFRSAEARVNSLQKTYDLVKLGPRHEQVDAARGAVAQAQGAVSFAETQLSNTIIRAPVTGTILERAVERGEFVTTSFVGERGAKGYVVSLADLNDLEVELDISQNDFGRLSMKQNTTITVDAYPDKKWQGWIKELSPEANRQKATVQVKVKVANPDQFLRPEMNATVAFLGKADTGAPGKASVYVPPAALSDGKVWVVEAGVAVQRDVKTGGNTPAGIRIDDGLKGGEELIVNPPKDLKPGAKVVVRGARQS